MVWSIHAARRSPVPKHAPDRPSPGNPPDQAVSEAVTACQDRIRNGRPSRAPARTLPQPTGPDLADVYICAAVAAAEARSHRVTLRQELIRLVVHGTLHALGYDHPEGEARARSAMWRRQERYVTRILQGA